MSWKSFCLTVDPCCLKRKYTQAEYERITQTCKRINATDLYKVYRWYGDMPYVEFYKKIRGMFYFDKYECEHGTEFLYYVKFTELELEERLPTDVIKIYGGNLCLRK